MSRRSAELTTTSYAMLGMLAIRPWSTYELAQHLERGVARLWPPSARSKLYTEPKKLAARGLVKATDDQVGNRPRTVYTITPAGRRAFKAWLATPSEPTRLESEQLLKVFFGEQGTTSQLRAAIADLERWARERSDENVEVARSYLDGSGPFPERAAVLALTGRFMSDFADMVSRWAEWAGSIVERWPDDPKLADPDWDTYRSIAGRSPRSGDPASSSSRRAHERTNSTDR
jgi:DNA-binding PadR family transcriptional regulator